MRTLFIITALLLMCLSVEAQEQVDEHVAVAEVDSAAVSDTINKELILSSSTFKASPMLGLNQTLSGSEKDMQRNLKVYGAWLTIGGIACLAAVDWLLFAGALSLVADIEGGSSNFLFFVPGIATAGLSTLGFVIAHQHKIKAKHCAPDLNAYRIRRLKKTGMATAIIAGVNLTTVLILNNALSADSNLSGFMLPSIPLALISINCFTKASKLSRESSLSVGATTLYEPQSIGGFTPRPAISLNINF